MTSETITTTILPPNSAELGALAAAAELVDSELYHCPGDRQEDIDRLATRHVVMAYDGPELVGVGSISTDDDPEEAYLSDIAVASAHRGRGVGSAVLTALEDIARRDGKSEAVCMPTVETQGFFIKRRYIPTSDQPGLHDYIRFL